MIAIIRIKGRVNVSKRIKESLSRLRLRKKYACVVIKEKKELLGMLNKVRDFVAFGKIDKDRFKELLEKRARKIDKNKKMDIEKVVEGVFENNARLEEFNIRPYFRLHPPKGGFRKGTKREFPRGVLGNHGEKIGELIRRML